MTVELEFCERCTKIIPTGEVAHIWVDEIVCGPCHQILGSVTPKQPVAQDAQKPVITHQSQWRTTYYKAHKPVEKYATCPQCKHVMKNGLRCSNCRFVPTRSSMAVLPL